MLAYDLIENKRLSYQRVISILHSVANDTIC